MTKTSQEIYDEYYERIHYYLSQLVGDDEAEDLTQDVFIKVHKGLDSFKGQSSLSTWLYRIATNSGLDRLRSAWNRRINRDFCICEETGLPAIELTEQGVCAVGKEQSIPQQMIKSEMNECIREFVDKLPPDYRAVLVLSELKELKNSEISNILGINLSTVKIRLHRARASLKKEFQSGCEFYHDEDGLSCDRKTTGSCKDT